MKHGMILSIDRTESLKFPIHFLLNYV